MALIVVSLKNTSQYLLRGAIQTHRATFNVDSTLGWMGVSIAGVKNVAVLDKRFSSVFRTKEPLKTLTKLTSIHFWYSNALSMPFPARNCYRMSGFNFSNSENPRQNF